jgi:hypothetical protein
MSPSISAMSPLCLINQPAGLGDIMYTLQIGYLYSSRGYNVIWPLIDQYMWIPRYISSPSIRFVSISSEFPLKELMLNGYTEVYFDPSGNIYIPLARSLVNSSGRYYPLMYSKYMMVGLGPLARNWPYYVSINRNLDSERSVTDFYGKHLTSEYIYANSLIGSPDGHLTRLAEMDQSIKRLSAIAHVPIIEHCFIDGTTMFDFIPVLANAVELHLPNSALCWLVEYMVHNQLCRHDQKRYMYPRDRNNKINDNYRYLKNCYCESNWFFVPPSSRAC